MNDLEDLHATAQFAFDATVQTLKRSSDVDSCLSLTTKIDKRLDSVIAQAQQNGERIACRAGCSFCCYTERVTVVPHEAIALFRYLNSRIPPDLQKDIADRFRWVELSTMQAAGRGVSSGSRS